MKRLKQIDGVTIHCCVCLNQGRTVPAVTIIDGYAVCKAHVEVVSHPDFRIMSLHGGGKRPV